MSDLQRVAADSPVSGTATARDKPPLLSTLNTYGFRLVMLADLLMLYALMLGSMFVRFGTQWPSYPVPLYLLSFVVVASVFLASFYFGGLYERDPRLGAPPVLPRAARQALTAGGVVALLTLSLTGLARELEVTVERALPFPITNLVVLIVFGAAGVAVNRRLVHLWRTRREGPPRVLLVGKEADVAVARDHLAKEAKRATVAGVAHSTDDLLELVDDASATDVVLVTHSMLDHLYPSPLDELERTGVAVLLRVTARETVYGLQRVREVAGLPFVLLQAQSIPRSRARFKRLFDLAVLLLLVPLLVPLLVAVTLYQLAVVGRPLLFWQVRVGVGGRLFRMVKFRTMVVDAENDGRGARLAEVDDPRVIPACRWIRTMRLDELPQLWNVLKGEMSLVGPRPERPELTASFEDQIPGYARRYELPPGLTGLAQIHGRYHTDAEYKLGYDLQYLVDWSPVLDIEILFRTMWVVLARRL